MNNFINSCAENPEKGALTMESEQAAFEETQLSELEESVQEIEKQVEVCTGEEKVDVSAEKQDEEAGSDHEKDRSSFIHGLSVGLGMGCIATFIMMWITVFFAPMLPPTMTYESLLSIFIYPLLYLLAVGLIALTAGIVREYYAGK